MFDLDLQIAFLLPIFIMDFPANMNAAIQLMKVYLSFTFPFSLFPFFPFSLFPFFPFPFPFPFSLFPFPFSFSLFPFSLSPFPFPLSPFPPQLSNFLLKNVEVFPFLGISCIFRLLDNSVLEFSQSVDFFYISKRLELFVLPFF